jgi:hypothetical protein
MADVLGHGVVLQPFEAVAIVQELIHQTPEAAGFEARPVPPSPGDVTIRSDGSVAWAKRPGRLSPAEVAILLQMLMTGSSRVPGGIQYAIARALHDVEGAGFQSVEEFSSVLIRHERRDRAAVLRALGGRVSRIVAAPDRLKPGVAGTSSTERRSTPSLVTELRRELRTADLALFHSRASAPRAATAAPAWARRVPPVVIGLTAGLVVALSGETVRLYRAPSTVTIVPAPASPSIPMSLPAVPQALPPQTATESLPIPPPPARDAAVTRTSGPVAVAASSEPRSSTVGGVKRRVTKKASANRQQKPKRRRFLGLPIFSS